jgi:hypothetical protein
MELVIDPDTVSVTGAAVFSARLVEVDWVAPRTVSRDVLNWGANSACVSRDADKSPAATLFFIAGVFGTLLPPPPPPLSESLEQPAKGETVSAAIRMRVCRDGLHGRFIFNFVE